MPNRRLVLDARPSAAGAIDPGQRLLGLSLLRRTVLASRRSGFGEVVVIAASGDAERFGALLADHTGVTVRSAPPEETANGAPTVYAPANLLGERAWLDQVGRETVADDQCRSAGDGVLLCGSRVPPGTAVAGNATLNGTADRIDLTRPPLRIAGKADLRAAEQRLLRALVKDSDGFMARRFARPISLAISRRLAPFGVTPNQMTFVSMLIGLSAAPFFLSQAPMIQVIGGLLFVLHSVIDGCDGELARLKYQESRIGGLLDFLSDNVVHVAVFGCMAVGWWLAADTAWPLYAGAAAVGGAGGSAIAVYALTLRRKTGDGPVFTSVSRGPSAGLTKLLDSLSRRDFIYLVLALSAFGKAAWFLVLAGVGAPIFLLLVLVAAGRRAGAGRFRLN